MPTAAERLSEFATDAAIRRHPGRRRSRQPSCTCSTRSAARWRRTEPAPPARAVTHSRRPAVSPSRPSSARARRPPRTGRGVRQRRCSAHGLDFDDTHPDSLAHVGAVVGPASLAAAEASGADGRDLLTAIVAGNEIVTRIGMAVTGAVSRSRIPRHRGVRCLRCGVAAACRLRNVSAATAASALGIAGSFAGGLFVYLEEGTPTKPIHPAWAAHGALIATDLASRGAQGPTTVLEGRFGFYHAFVGAERGPSTLERAARRSRHALGDAADRVQALPGLPLHPRLASAPPRACSREIDADRIVAHRGHGAGGRGGARARARRRQGATPDRVRGQVQPAVLDRRDDRLGQGRHRDLHACGDRAIRRCSTSPGR